MSCDKFKLNDEEKLLQKKIIQFLIYVNITVLRGIRKN